MTAVYMSVPVITLRPPEDHERVLNCNGCHAPSVFSVLETGTLNVYDGKRRGSTASSYRMCRECTRVLRGEVITSVTFDEDGYVVFREDADV